MEKNERLHKLALRLVKVESDLHHRRQLPNHAEKMNEDINKEGKTYGLSPNEILNYALDNRDALIGELEKLDPKNPYKTDHSKTYATGTTV